MSTKTITILDKAYEALAKEKGEEESFSDVILKITGRKGKLSDSFGKWVVSVKEMKEIEKELRKAWESWKK